MQFFSSSFDDEFNLQRFTGTVTSNGNGNLVTATASIVLPSTVSFDFQRCIGKSDAYLVTAMASILLSSVKISQLTNVHNYEPQAFFTACIFQLI